MCLYFSSSNLLIKLLLLTKFNYFFFQEHLPVISILCNPGIRDRHWDKMSTIFERNLKPDTGTTLRKVLQLGLEPYMERFEQVSAAASKVRLNST